MNQPIYLALDFPTWVDAKDFIDTNDLAGVPVKVGMELFYKEGPYIIEELKTKGHSIFLDLKLFDIPTTVQNAMKNIAKLGVDIVNIHALGGSHMIEAAKEGLVSVSGNQTKLLAVTILTSTDQTLMNSDMLINGGLQESVVKLAKLSKQHGADGVVCSVEEAKAIKESCGKDFLAVTPGIRLKNTDSHDQKRVATPTTARICGVDQLVIGRSITQAKHPKQAYEQAMKEWLQ